MTQLATADTSPAAVHQTLAAAMEVCFDAIDRIQREPARTGTLTARRGR